MKWFPTFETIENFYLSLNGFLAKQISDNQYVIVDFWNEVNQTWDSYKFENKKWILQN